MSSSLGCGSAERILISRGWREANRNRIADSVDHHRQPLVLKFLDCKNLVSRNIVQCLMDPARPANFNIFDPLVTRESKVHATVARGSVADRGRDFIPLLPSIFASNVKLRSDSHAIAFGPHKFQYDPVVSSIGNIAKKLDLSIEHRHHSIDASLIEKIAKSNPAMGSLELEIGSSRATYISELTIAQVTKQ
jgi:hypothetical protein